MLSDKGSSLLNKSVEYWKVKFYFIGKMVEHLTPHREIEDSNPVTTRHQGVDNLNQNEASVCPWQASPA
jgi:hypothetical protein